MPQMFGAMTPGGPPKVLWLNHDEKRPVLGSKEIVVVADDRIVLGFVTIVISRGHCFRAELRHFDL